MAALPWKKSSAGTRVYLSVAAVAVMAVSIVWLSPSGHASAYGAADYADVNVTYNGKSFSVQKVTVDLKDPYLRVEPVEAQEGIGHVESLGSIAERSGAVAAVNGTFFDAYEADDSSRYPNGLMLSGGTVIHSGGNQAIAVGSDKLPQIIAMKTADSVTVQRGSAKPYTFTAWGVNKYYGAESTDQVVVYTKEFGPNVAFGGGTKAVVDESDRIVQLTTGSAAIPEDGYVVFVGHSANNRQYVLPELHVGDTVKLGQQVTAGSVTSGGYEWEAALGAGPKLLTNGAVDIDYTRDGFTDPKITSAAGVRSFVGVDGSKRLVFGNVSSATIGELAGVLLQLGLTDAMNLDGGASSGLYANGTMVRYPGRLLSNALVVKRYDKPQVQIAVNGNFVNEFRGFIQGETTMAPFRGIFERIKATFQWDGNQRVLTAQKGGTTIVLRPNDPYATVNGAKVKLDEAPTIVDDHIYIPLRFVTQTLGAKVDWNQNLYRATVTIP
ncbi:stalk domain-containing protein [Paenibacillus cymbidii]|uniref:stalk domain-containing protein n=1 Tax=Paenibacillus cymbidii TaxID=1639034 RepID=UPI001080FD5C|nr:stalk domain-containing protein [Paenibacillus cymbidii]